MKTIGSLLSRYLKKASGFSRLDRLDSRSDLILDSNWTGFVFYFVADSCGRNLDGFLPCLRDFLPIASGTAWSCRVSVAQQSKLE